MNTKTLVVAACFGIAALLFGFVGFDIVTSTKYNLAAIGLMFTAIGLLIQFVWTPAK